MAHSKIEIDQARLEVDLADRDIAELQRTLDWMRGLISDPSISMPLSAIQGAEDNLAALKAFREHHATIAGEG